MINVQLRRSFFLKVAGGSALPAYSARW